MIVVIILIRGGPRCEAIARDIIILKEIDTFAFIHS